MKLATGIQFGPQADLELKLQRYFVVLPDHDFQGNAHVDVTTIEDLRLFYRYSRCDYKLYRLGIKTYVNSVGWINLTAAEKAIAAAEHAVDRSKMDEVHSLQKQTETGFDFHYNSVICRRDRMFQVETIVANRLAPIEIGEIIGQIMAAGLSLAYIQYGREGGVEDGTGIPMLFDYVEARAGGPWENTGIAAKAFTVRNEDPQNPDIADCAALANELIKVLKYGLY